jgi:hypothetical protein
MEARNAFVAVGVQPMPTFVKGPDVNSVTRTGASAPSKTMKTIKRKQWSLSKLFQKCKG